MSLIAEFAAVFRDLPAAFAEAARDVRDDLVSLFTDDNPTGGAS